MKALATVMMVVVCGLCAQTAEGKPEEMTTLMQSIKNRLLADRVEEAEARERLEEAGIELGVWRRIGPFRDQGPLLNWMDNAASSFAYEFAVAKDTRDNGNAPLLDKTYQAPNFPAIGKRRPTRNPIGLFIEKILSNRSLPPWRI